MPATFSPLVLLRRLWFWGLLLLLAGAVLGCWEGQRSLQQVLEDYEQEVQQTFEQDLERLQQGKDYLANNKPFLRLTYNAEGKLLSWNTNQWRPTDEQVARWLRNPQQGLVQDQFHSYYVLLDTSGGQLQVQALPLRLTYPLQYRFLRHYLYLGPYTAKAPQQQAFSARDLLEQQVQAPGISLRAPLPTGGYQLVAHLPVQNPLPLRQPVRRVVFWLGLVGALLVLVGLGRVLAQRSALAELAFFVLLLALRYWMLKAFWPATYLYGDLFSPQLLAINRWTPSLGDFLLNTALAAYLLYRLGQQVKRLPWRGAVWSLRLAAVLGAVAVAVSQLFVLRTYQAVVNNSSLLLDFTQLPQFTGGSVLAVAALLALQLAVLRWQLAWSDLLHPLGAPRWKLRLLAVGASVGAVGVLALWGGAGPAELADLAWVLLAGYVAAVFGLSGLTLQGGPWFSTRLLALLALGAGLNGLVLQQAVGEQLARGLRKEMLRFAEQRDLMAETYFRVVAKKIMQDSTWWQVTASENGGLSPTRLPQEALNKLMQQNLFPIYRGYRVRVFVFNRWGRRLDPVQDAEPIRLPPRTTQTQTESDYLLRVNFPKNPYGYVYVSQLSVQAGPLGLLKVQLELHPQTPTVNKLYSLLLQPKGALREQMLETLELQLGLYKGRELQRWLGPGALPKRSQMVDFQLDTLQAAPADSLANPPANPLALAPEPPPGYAQEALLVEGDQFVVARWPQRPWYLQLTPYFLLFLGLSVMLLLGLIITWGPTASWRLLLEQFSLLGLRFQLVLLLLGLLPLLVIWAVTLNLFESGLRQQVLQEMDQKLEQLADQLKRDDELIRSLGRSYAPQPTQAARTQLQNLSGMLLADLNVYDRRGELYSTTAPFMVRTMISSGQMNPEVYNRLAQGRMSRWITQEQIGGLEFYSGYAALYNSRNEVVGFVNLPFVLQQDQLNQQKQRYLAYLVNSYLVVIFLVLGVGLILSRRVTRPLRLLKQKMEATQLGNRNEPVSWRSRDEIGALIASYNRMLEQLAESERQLSRSQREKAWREMARQVAHEIKNPLTPMRLSVQQLQRNGQTGKVNPEKLEQTARTLIQQIDSLVEIANSFSALTQMPQGRLREVDLQELCRQVAQLYEQSREAELQAELPDHACLILADPAQLNRALVNLQRNSLQALSSQAKPDTQPASTAQGEAAGSPKVWLRLRATSSSYVVEVADNGPGIPEAIRERIFEPNFSTKTSGMGLGLAITRNSVEQAGGSIRYETELGVGTTFYLEFPRADSAPAENRS